MLVYFQFLQVIPDKQLGFFYGNSECIAVSLEIYVILLSFRDADCSIPIAIQGTFHHWKEENRRNQRQTHRGTPSSND